MCLQALREYQSDTFDDWRDLLEEQERRTRDELDASKVFSVPTCRCSIATHLSNGECCLLEYSCMLSTAPACVWLLL